MTSLRLGVNIPNFGPTTSPSLLRQWGAFAEDNGFALAMMSDHVAPTPDVTSLYPAPFYDPFIALAWMAEITQHLDIGTGGNPAVVFQSHLRKFSLLASLGCLKPQNLS